MYNVLILIFLKLFASFMTDASDVVAVSVMEGDSLTLNTDGRLQHQQNRIRWFFNTTHIAQVTRQSHICTECSKGTERFSDRLKVDRQTGSLTITDIRNTDSGDYRLHTLSSSEKIFRVVVHTVSTAEQDKLKSKSVNEGESVTLNPGEIKSPDDSMEWYFDDDFIADIIGGNSNINKRFRRKLQLDLQTGSLTLKKTKITDSGDYKLEIISRFGVTRMKKFSVHVTGLHGERSDLLTISLVVLTGIAPLITMIMQIVLNYRISQPSRQWGEVKTLTAGDPFTLKTENEIQTNNVMTFKFETTDIAKVTFGTDKIHIYESQFKGRMQILTGGLTITESKTTDSGCYQLHIKKKEHEVNIKFLVVVFGESRTVNVNGKIYKAFEVVKFKT